jgi:hypothetical protein
VGNTPNTPENNAWMTSTNTTHQRPKPETPARRRPARRTTTSPNHGGHRGAGLRDSVDTHPEAPTGPDTAGKAADTAAETPNDTTTGLLSRTGPRKPLAGHLRASTAPAEPEAARDTPGASRPTGRRASTSTRQHRNWNGHCREHQQDHHRAHHRRRAGSRGPSRRNGTSPGPGIGEEPAGTLQHARIRP